MPYSHYGKWRARWVDAKGKQHSKNFDDHRSAAAHENKMKAEVDEVRKGLRAPTPVRRTCSQVFDEWLNTRAKSKRSGGDDFSIIKLHLRPAFGHCQLDKVGVEDAERFIRSKAHLSKKTVHNLLTLFIATLNFAHDLGWLLRVPRIKKPRVRMHSTDYQYLRTDEELRRFLLASQKADPVIHPLYATAVYTGARAGELAGLRWEDVDFDKRLITIQRSFDGPTKAEDVRYVPILDALLPILRAWRLCSCERVVFPSEAGTMFRNSSRAFQEVLHRVLARGGFPKVTRGGRTRPYIRFHDLRHTFASQWMMRGGDLFKLQRILGHKSSQMTQRYAHLSPEAFAEDFARFGGQVGPCVVTALPVKAQTAKSGT